MGHTMASLSMLRWLECKRDGGAGESRLESGTGSPTGGVRGCVLESDADAAANGISDCLFGLVADAIIFVQTASMGAERWVC